MRADGPTAEEEENKGSTGYIYYTRIKPAYCVLVCIQYEDG